MCGFAGVFADRTRRPRELEDNLERMADRVRHRGPDDSGTWTSPDGRVGLGFRRLSILDLSSAGHQPMASETGRYVMVFNGEVYNYRELGAALPDRVRFRGHSDTEVILAAFEAWGIPGAVRRFTGMFAMAVWDTERQQLTLIRDRLGIKPLYVYARAGVVLFGSELKALIAHPDFDRAIDPVALTGYLAYLQVPTPYTIFRNCAKLLPGTTLTIRDPAAALPEPEPFWSLEDIALSGQREPLADSPELVERVELSLREAVRLRMRSDVPVGALLSGGLDSSLVTALMQEETSRPVRTFCIAFDDTAHDESTHAEAVARHLGTAHTTVRMTQREILDTIPRITEIFDEPFANPSNLPTLLVCETARRDVTVALAGDGGDEVFAGYNRYRYGRRAIEAGARWPAGLRRALTSPLTLLSAGAWDRVYSHLAPALPGRRERLVGEKMLKLITLLRAPGEEEMYRSLLSAWEEPGRATGSAWAAGSDAIARGLGAKGLGLLERMQLADQLGYLPDDLLTKVDRVSMAASLEVRVPLIDHNVVELSWRLPSEAKVRGGTTKWVLREVLHRRVPRTLLDRPKTGFTVPLDTWLRGPLREWAETLLAPQRIGQSPWLDAQLVDERWRAFRKGRSELALQLWAVLMLEAWRERWA